MKIAIQTLSDNNINNNNMLFNNKSSIFYGYKRLSTSKPQKYLPLKSANDDDALELNTQHYATLQRISN